MNEISKTSNLDKTTQVEIRKPYNIKSTLNSIVQQVSSRALNLLTFLYRNRLCTLLAAVGIAVTPFSVPLGVSLTALAVVCLIVKYFGNNKAIEIKKIDTKNIDPVKKVDFSPCIEMYRTYIEAINHDDVKGDELIQLTEALQVKVQSFIESIKEIKTYSEVVESLESDQRVKSRVLENWKKNLKKSGSLNAIKENVTTIGNRLIKLIEEKIML
jgi:hypothetical protein